MKANITAIVVAAVLGMGIGAAVTTVVEAQRGSAGEQCGRGAAPRARTTLYFGTARPKGSVSELEWQVFLRDEVTKRFPDGLTVWDAEGQWRASTGTIDHERSKVLLLVHGDTPAAREAVQAVIATYLKSFDQQSVLWETARVCAAS